MKVYCHNFIGDYEHDQGTEMYIIRKWYVYDDYWYLGIQFMCPKCRYSKVKYSLLNKSPYKEMPSLNHNSDACCEYCEHYGRSFCKTCYHYFHTGGLTDGEHDSTCKFELE